MFVCPDAGACVHLALPDALVLADARAGSADGRPRGVNGWAVLA
ncbi:hypothetical protein [Ralstonia solanacearum]|nr:hypothetical protein [Ralstonia solanacearum]